MPTMARGLFIDFHAHLRGKKDIQAPETPNFPLLTAAADVLEPALVEGINLFARHGRHRVMTQFYPLFKRVGFNEIIRQFNKYQIGQLLASMDACGIERTIIAAIEPFFETLDLLETIQPHAERFAVFCSVDPEDPEYAQKFEEYVATGMVYGMKIHPAMAGPSPTSERMFEMMALAQKHRLPVIIHTGTFPFPLTEGANNVLALEPVIKAFPDVPIVLAHIGWDQSHHVLALGHDYANCYTDTSWQPVTIIREAISAFGIRRVLFGSDFPLFQQATALGTLIEAVRPEELNLVGYENARALLARSHPDEYPPRGAPPGT
jgi:predicted TIM-barrel fold metal-dependent hydrolase